MGKILTIVEPVMVTVKGAGRETVNVNANTPLGGQSPPVSFGSGTHTT